MDISLDTAQKLVTQIVARFKQELDGENTELLDRLVRSYNTRLARIAWKESQKWCKWNEDGPVLMPNYTRIYYRKADTEVILQEFPPQTRLLKFTAGLTMRPEDIRDINAEQAGEVKTYSLALPYTIFIFKFVSGRFQVVQCAFSDRPLKKLDEKPLKPYFTNVDPELHVCLGRSFNHANLEIGNIAQQSAYVLDHFWQSVFSNEWSSHYWENVAHFKTTDPRLASLASWEDATGEDPLFVVDNVNWLKYSDDNFGDIIVRHFDFAGGDNLKFHEALFKEVVEGMLNELKSTIAENVSTVEKKLIKLDINKELEKLN